MNELVKYSDNVTKLATEIKVIQDNVCQGMIEIGKRLIEIKKELGHGQWLPFIEKELGYGVRTANNLMKVANEFSNSQTFSNLTSSKIFALLDIPQEHRNDFIKSHEVEDSTVRQLKEEIQKYKEENGLLTEKQRKALEEKRKVEEQAKQLQQELQREKSRPPKIETKVEYKEKVVDKTDYSVIDKIKKLEEDNKRLAESKKRYEDAMNTYKKEVEQYHGLKDRMSRISCIDGGDVDELKALDDVNNLYLSINKFIKNELSPVRYDNCLRFINGSEHVTRSFINMISIVEEWCSDMREKLNENNNIITVEVK